MTPEENERRAKDKHVNEIKNRLCDKNSGKPFVFISYKSDDWEIVLHDIVYRLMNDYGLNVYFDGSFDLHNDLWTLQFPVNMKSYNCKGVIAFVDDKYATSYATLLELMYSQTIAVNKKVVSVNLGKIKNHNDADGERDTGLGDDTENLNAEKEAVLFNKVFRQLVDLKVLKKSQYWYEEGETLTRKICSIIVRELLGYLAINENNYREPGGDLKGIVHSIMDAFGAEVFSNVDGGSAKENDADMSAGNGDESHEETDAGNGDESHEKTDVESSDESHEEAGAESNNESCGNDVDNPAKLKKKSNGSFYTFTCNGERFEKRTLKEMMLTVFKHILKKNSDKIEKLMDILSCLGEGDRIDKKAKPGVFRAGEVVEINGRIISIGTSLNEEAVLKYIDKLIESCNENADVFRIEEKILKDTYEKVDVPSMGNWRMNAGTERQKQPESTGEIIKSTPVEDMEAASEVKKIAGNCGLEDFLAEYNQKTFQASSYKSIKLIGVNGCERYTTDKDQSGKVFKSARNLVFQFAMNRLDEMGMKYIETVNASFKTKNPIFITWAEHRDRRERNVNISYIVATSAAVTGYSMCTHYSEYGWLKSSLVKQLKALGLPLENFRLEFE